MTELLIGTVSWLATFGFIVAAIRRANSAATAQRSSDVFCRTPRRRAGAARHGATGRGSRL